MKNKKNQAIAQITTQSMPIEYSVASGSSNFFKWHSLIVFMIGMLCYVNTLNHGYTQDDAIVIYDNMYTKEGFSGLKGLFTKDTFFGFFKTEGKANLVKGGRYRPMTPAMFAIEYKLADGKPWLGHLMNVLHYGFLCWMIYKFLAALILHKNNTEMTRYMVLAAALLFAVHPLHTEAVANIKGRDEIVAMIASITAAWMTVRYFDKGKISSLILAACVFLIGLMSKENTITFLAVVPLCLYYFRDLTLGSAIARSLFLLVPTVLFLMIRFSVLGNDFGGEPQELMNNPFLKLVDGNYIAMSGMERFSTIMYTLGRYVMLLIWPHPLTNDYYPRHIGIMTLSDPGVLGSILLYIGLIWLSIWGLRRKHILGFGAAYYLITLSIVSNVIFPIGTNMSERFMFMPSLGFVLILAYGLVQLFYKQVGSTSMLMAMGLIAIAGIGKTFTRNMAWENDFTLFTTDVNVSKNSAKAQNAAGGSLTSEALKLDENGKPKYRPEQQKEMYIRAIGHLQKSVQIHPTYKNPYLIMGNSHYYLQEYDAAIKAYETAIAIDPSFEDANKNLGITLNDAGKAAGEKENNIPKALGYLNKAYKHNPNDILTNRLLGVANGVSKNHAVALPFFEKVVQLDPNTAAGFVDLSNAYRNVGQVEKSNEAMQKAVQLDPKVMENMGKR